jgi:hypothetical protein
MIGPLGIPERTGRRPIPPLAAMALALVLAIPVSVPVEPARAESAVAQSAVAQSFVYVPGTGDIPLMPGLAMVPNSGMVFEAPGGRLVEAFARGQHTPSEVLAFYGATLPQMGWTAATPGSFHREGETLDLEFIGQAPNLTVRFSLAPNG